MNMNRRMTVFALLSGAIAGLALVAARRGFKGTSRLAARFGRPLQPTVEAKTYNYKEINLS